MLVVSCEPSARGQKWARSLKRHEKQAALDVVKAQAHSRAAQRDRRRRRHLMEASFADAANNHHFKRARWRRRWRQQIQDYLIASIQNLRILLKHYQPKRSAAAALSWPHLNLFILSTTISLLSPAASDLLLLQNNGLTTLRRPTNKPIWATRPIEIKV